MSFYNKRNIPRRIGHRERVERFYLKNPTATQVQAQRATGAPRATVRRVFDAMMLAGLLRPGNGKAMVRASLDRDCSPG